ncbi:MAG: hypothetical protein ACMXYL_04315 [Candidatus Woesearchaeota archaeon]
MANKRYKSSAPEGLGGDNYTKEDKHKTSELEFQTLKQLTEGSIHDNLRKGKYTEGMVQIGLAEQLLIRQGFDSALPFLYEGAIAELEALKLEQERVNDSAIKPEGHYHSNGIDDLIMYLNKRKEKGEY